MDAGAAAAETLAGMTGGGKGGAGGHLELWVSGDPVPFAPLAERFLQKKDLQVRKARRS